MVGDGFLNVGAGYRQEEENESMWWWIRFGDIIINSY